jgi:transcriptional regulator with XRE-family HTH domain
MVTRCDVKPAALRRLRAELALTQTQLAEELGVHRVTVARWETGERGIPEPVARLLVRIHGERKKRKK